MRIATTIGLAVLVSALLVWALQEPVIVGGVYAVAAVALTPAAFAILAVEVLAFLALLLPLSDIPQWFTSPAALYWMHAATAFALYSARRLTSAQRNRTHAFSVHLRPACAAAAALCWLAIFFRPTPAVQVTAWAALLTAVTLALPRAAGSVSPRNCKVWLSTSVLFFVSVFLTLALIETGARILFPKERLVFDVFSIHDEYVFLPRPNTDITARFNIAPGEVVVAPISISSQGLCDREYGPKTKDEFRIVMLGDSFTMGHGVQEHERLPRAIERVLNERVVDQRITVINGGVGGGGPYQHLGMWRLRCRDLDPDLVLLQLYPSNDIENSYEAIGKHLRAYNAAWKRQLLTYQHWAIPYYRIEAYVLRHSTAYRLVRRFTGNRTWIGSGLNSLRFLPHYTIPSLPPSEDRLFAVEFNLDQWYPEMTEAFDVFTGHIRTLREEVEASGADLVACVIPALEVVGDARWTEWTEERVTGVDYERGKAIRVTSEMLEAEGIPHVDTFETLRAHPLDRVFYIYDGHLTPFGNEVAGRAIANFLIDSVLHEHELSFSPAPESEVVESIPVTAE